MKTFFTISLLLIIHVYDVEAQILPDFKKIKPVRELIEETRSAIAQTSNMESTLSLEGALFIHLVQRGNYPPADSIYQKLAPLLKIDGPDELHRTIIASKAFMDKINTRYQSSLSKYLSLLSYYEQAGNLPMQFITQVHLAEYFRAKGEGSSIYDRLKSAERLSKKTSKIPLIDLAYWHSRMGNFFIRTQFSDSAYYHLNAGLELLQSEPSNYIEGLIQNEIGYDKINSHPEEADSLLRRSMDLFWEAEYFRHYMDASNNYGLVQVFNKKYKNAEKTFLHIISFAAENKLNSALEDAYGRLKNVAIDVEDAEKTILYNERRIYYAYLARNETYAIQANELAANFEKNLVEQRLLQQKAITELASNKSRDNWRIFILTILLLITVSILCLFYYRLRQSLKKKTAELQQKSSQISELNIQLKSEITRRSILYKELHHRVKNNLSVLSGLIYLQESSLGLVTKSTRFHILRNRIKAMAMVHEKLYQQEEESNAILLPIYLQYLINEIKNSANSRSDIDINLDCSNVYLSIDMAIPIAMIVSELLTQAMNKSFSSVDHPALSIVYRQDKNQASLTYTDNSGNNPTNQHSKEGGQSKLIQLIAQELNGICDWTNSDNGTSFKMIWSLDEPSNDQI